MRLIRISKETEQEKNCVIDKFLQDENIKYFLIIDEIFDKYWINIW